MGLDSVSETIIKSYTAQSNTCSLPTSQAVLLPQPYKNQHIMSMQQIFLRIKVILSSDCLMLQKEMVEVTSLLSVKENFGQQVKDPKRRKT